MTDHVMGGWAPRVLRGLVAFVLGAAAGIGGVLLAIVSFEWTAWAPAAVSLGLILGGALTVPLWSFFPVDTGGDLESLGR